MPELPEVQTVINYLNPRVKGQKIIGVDVLADKMLKNASLSEFKEVLTNATIENITRIGKYLIFHLDNNYVMVSHLRMEGKYLIKQDKDFALDKHIHLIFQLKDFNLYYHDTRKFGTFTIYKNIDFLNSKELVKIAIDPLDLKFNADYLFDQVKDSKKLIKTILLEQSIVSGIGNIYASEILFGAQVLPFRLGSSITKLECEKIVKEAKRILSLAIKNHGTTVSSFSFDDNHAGLFQNYLSVYNLANKPCSKCQGIILKDYINKRGTYYCPNCQK